MSENTVETSTTTAVTGYQAAKLLTALFEADGISREVVPQQVYTYINNGTVESVETGEIDKRTGKPKKAIELPALKDLYERLAAGQVKAAVPTETLLAELKAL